MNSVASARTTPPPSAKSAWRHSRTIPGPSAAWEEEQGSPESHFADWLGNTRVIGSFSDTGMLTGMIGVSTSKTIKTQHVGWICGMYVRPTARGTGLSLLLLRAAIDEVGTSLRSLRLSVVSSNIPAIRLYKSMGFEEWAVEM
jgi:ribosomal protein S18 acetylase RimI-like enzyme